jgi:hypothetical protein
MMKDLETFRRLFSFAQSTYLLGVPLASWTRNLSDRFRVGYQVGYTVSDLEELPESWVPWGHPFQLRFRHRPQTTAANLTALLTEVVVQ